MSPSSARNAAQHGNLREQPRPARYGGQDDVAVLCNDLRAQGGSRVAPPQGNRFGHRTASKVACSITAPAITTCQHDEGVEGSAGQNPIRDLKQVNRNGQHQQVCGASLDHDRAEVAAHDLAAPLQLLNKLLRPCVFVELWR